jgi:hypothetical protein
MAQLSTAVFVLNAGSMAALKAFSAAGEFTPAGSAATPFTLAKAKKWI